MRNRSGLLSLSVSVLRALRFKWFSICRNQRRKISNPWNICWDEIALILVLLSLFICVYYCLHVFQSIHHGEDDTGLNISRLRARTITEGHDITAKKLPTVFKWEGGGKNVSISGSFDGWKSKIPLVKRWALLYWFSFALPVMQKKLMSAVWL